MTCHGCKPPRGKACHCAICHQDFATLKLFDKHQDVKYGRTPAIVCRKPEELELVLDTWGTWRTRENLLNVTSRVSHMNTQREIRNRGKHGKHDTVAVPGPMEGLRV